MMKVSASLRLRRIRRECLGNNLIQEGTPGKSHWDRVSGRKLMHRRSPSHNRMSQPLSTAYIQNISPRPGTRRQTPMGTEPYTRSRHRTRSVHRKTSLRRYTGCFHNKPPQQDILPHFPKDRVNSIDQQHRRSSVRNSRCPRLPAVDLNLRERQICRHKECT